MKSIVLSGSAVCIRLLANLAGIAILTRVLSLEVFGIVSVGLLAGQIFSIIADAGVNNDLLRRFSKSGSEDYEHYWIQSVRVRLLLIPVVATIVYFLLAYLVGHGTAGIVVAVAAGAVLAAISETYFQMYRASGSIRKELMFSIGLSVSLLIFYSLVNFCPEWVGLLLLLPRFIVLLAMMLTSMHLGKLRSGWLGFRGEFARYYWGLRHYALDSISSNIGMQLDNLLVFLSLGVASLAQYQPASRIVLSAIGVGSVIAGLAIPRASKMTDRKEVLRYLLQMFGGVGLGLSLIVLIVLVCGLEILFGKNFELSLPVIVMLSGILLMRFIAAGMGSFLMLEGGQAFRAKVNASLVLFVLVAGVLFGGSMLAILSTVMLGQAFLLLAYCLKSRG